MSQLGLKVTPKYLTFNISRPTSPLYLKVILWLDRAASSFSHIDQVIVCPVSTDGLTVSPPHFIWHQRALILDEIGIRGAVTFLRVGG